MAILVLVAVAFICDVWYDSTLRWLCCGFVMAGTDPRELEDGTYTTIELPGAGSVITCRIAEEKPLSYCSGGTVYRVRILSGERKGQKWWVCASQVGYYYPPAP